MEDLQYLEDEAARIQQLAYREVQAGCSDRQRKWTNRLDRAVEGSAGELHKLSKIAEPWRPRPDHHRLGDAADPLVVTEAARQTWAVEWQVGTAAQAQDRPWEAPPVGEALRPLQEEDLDRACRCFKVRTGLGVDNFHPRTVLLLPPAGKRAVLQVIQRMEAKGIWPVRQQSIL